MLMGLYQVQYKNWSAMRIVLSITPCDHQASNRKHTIKNDESMQYMNWRQCIICLWIFVIAFVLMMGSILTITTTIKLKQQHTNRNNNNKNNRSTLTHLPTLSEFMLKSNYLHNNTKKTTKSSPGLITTTAAKRTTIQTHLSSV